MSAREMEEWYESKVHEWDEYIFNEQEKAQIVAWLKNVPEEKVLARLMHGSRGRQRQTLLEEAILTSPSHPFRNLSQFKKEELVALARNKTLDLAWREGLVEKMLYKNYKQKTACFSRLDECELNNLKLLFLRQI